MSSNPRVTIDFETRSVADLRKVGAWNYARHESTDILCLAYKLPGSYVRIWIPARGPLPKDLVDFIGAGGLVEAHNAGFETVIWEFVGKRRYGFPDINASQWRCSASVAAMHAIPRSLKDSCKVMGLRHQKDMTGHKLMMRMCKPRKLTKAEILQMTGRKGMKKSEVDSARKHFEREHGPYWHEDPADLARLCLYCGRDVLAEHGLSKALGPLPPRELRLWQLTNKINRTGVYIDTDFAEAAISIMGKLKAEAEFDLLVKTGGFVETVGQSAKIQEWVSEQRYCLPNVQKATVLGAIEDPRCPDHVKDVLRIRQQYNRSSVTKYAAMLDRADSFDQRVRDHVRFYGAHTGRLSGQGIQTQNFPKPDEGISFKQILLAMRAAKITRDAEFFSGLFANAPAYLSAALRPTIQAGPNQTFVCVDYSSIEAVLTLWFCRDPGLELFRRGLCLYKDLAGVIYGLDDPQSMTKKDPMRGHGKVGVLGSGYGAGWKTVQEAAKLMFNLDLSDDLAKKIVDSYRTKYSKVPVMWRRLQKAFLDCVVTKSDRHVTRDCWFQWGWPFVRLHLPSNRPLHYFKPIVRMSRAPWGEDIPTVWYWTEDSQTRKWIRTKTYGGKILENIIQAIARDIMCDAAEMISKNPKLGVLVMTVHDELVFLVLDVNNPKAVCEEICRLMRISPSWGQDCPIDVEAWVGKEYRK